MIINPSSEFWKGKRVLITGHTGFKGSWLSIWLTSMGAKVTGLALEPNTSPNLFSIAKVENLIENVFLDIRDYESVVSAVSHARPEIVFHLAAQSLVRPSYSDPVGTYATNVMGTVHLLDAVRKYGETSVFINVTSDKCYENFEINRPYKESDKLGGYDPYSNSKACSELITSAFRNSFFQDTINSNQMALASVRAGNVIGGGDWSLDRLIPDCVRSLVRNETILIRSPSAIRPWQHVLEPLLGYIRLAEKMNADLNVYSEAWNFGPYDSEVQTVEWIVEKFIASWGKESAWEVQSGAHLHEAHFLSVDASKAHEKLDWYPRLSINGAVSWSSEWYRKYYEGGDPAQLCMEQISSYQLKTELKL